MSIYINEDHELRLIWCKYENRLANHQHLRSMCLDEYTLYEWEQNQFYLESQLRAEINDTRRYIRFENAQREKIRKFEREQRENQLKNSY